MIGIKDTEMPICCAECFFYDEYDGFCRRLGISKWDEYIKETNYSDYDWKYEKRADICPLVEIEERKVGEWENTYNKEEWWNDIYKCSLCGWTTLDNGFYCPYCGAEMRNGEDDDKSGY